METSLLFPAVLRDEQGSPGVPSRHSSASHPWVSAPVETLVSAARGSSRHDPRDLWRLRSTVGSLRLSGAAEYPLDLHYLRRYYLRRYCLRRYCLRRYCLRRYCLRRYYLRRYYLRRYYLRR